MKTYTHADKQEIFDLAVEGLRQQGFKKSIKYSDREIYGSGAAGCRYLAHNEVDHTTLHCAIGHVIKNIYQPKMEGYDVGGLMIEFEDVRELFGISEKPVYHKYEDQLDFGNAEDDGLAQFLIDLQKAHDLSHRNTTDSMRRRLAHVGYEWGLVLPECLDGVEAIASL